MQAQRHTRIENASKADASGPIDLRHLSQQTMGDPGLEEEVLRMFDDIAHTYLARLEGSATVDDLVRNLHTLRGAAAGIGAFGLAELARVSESELRQGADINPERIADLGVAVEEVSIFIGARLRHTA